MAQGLKVQDLLETIPTIRRYAFALTRDRHDADDLVQDCLERALRKQGLFRPDSDLEAWMMTLCRRVFLNGVERRRVRGVHVDLHGTGGRALSARPPQESCLEFREVVAGFRRLPAQDRVLLALVAIEGLSYVEVSELLGIPVGTVRSRLWRARARLKAAARGRSHSGCVPT